MLATKISTQKTIKAWVKEQMNWHFKNKEVDGILKTVVATSP